MKAIETERLLLRPFDFADAEDLHREIYSDVEVVRYYSGKGVLTLDQTREHLAGHLIAWAEDDCGRHAFILKATGELLGQVHLNLYVNTFGPWPGQPETPFNQPEVELAFALGRRHWGKGYAYEACQALIRYAFGDLKLPRLVGSVKAPNVRSLNLHRRLGYRIERARGDDGYVTILENNQISGAADGPSTE